MMKQSSFALNNSTQAFHFCSSTSLLIATASVLLCLVFIQTQLFPSTNNNFNAVACIKRTQYHEQGVHGPKSYKFGFTSGDHKNPQERHEVSDKKGHVKGWYSYKDPHGKLMVFHYEAHPKKGFKIHKHKKHHG